MGATAEWWRPHVFHIHYGSSVACTVSCTWLMYSLSMTHICVCQYLPSYPAGIFEHAQMRSVVLLFITVVGVIRWWPKILTKDEYLFDHSGPFWVPNGPPLALPSSVSTPWTTRSKITTDSPQRFWKKLNLVASGASGTLVYFLRAQNLTSGLS